jgi:hypothetical protein
MKISKIVKVAAVCIFVTQVLVSVAQASEVTVTGVCAIAPGPDYDLGISFIMVQGEPYQPVQYCIEVTAYSAAYPDGYTSGFSIYVPYENNMPGYQYTYDTQSLYDDWSGGVYFFKGISFVAGGPGLGDIDYSYKSRMGHMMEIFCGYARRVNDKLIEYYMRNPWGGSTNTLIGKDYTMSDVGTFSVEAQINPEDPTGDRIIKLYKDNTVWILQTTFIFSVSCVDWDNDNKEMIIKNNDTRPTLITYYNAETLAVKRTETLSYDALDRVIRIEFDNGDYLLRTYENETSLIKKEDAYYNASDEWQKTIVFDALGREIVEKRPDGSIITKTYWGDSSVVETVAYFSTGWVWERTVFCDELGRQIKEKFASGDFIITTYQDATSTLRATDDYFGAGWVWQKKVIYDSQGRKYIEKNAADERILTFYWTAAGEEKQYDVYFGAGWVWQKTITYRQDGSSGIIKLTSLRYSLTVER